MMSKYKYEMGGIIRDIEIDMPYHTDDIVDLLDEKDQKIIELENNQNAKAVEALESVLKELEKQQFFSWNDTTYVVHPIEIACIVQKKIKEYGGKNE